jgi:large subunit ribosomal protein L22
MATNEHTAIVKARDLPISTKHTIEICNAIRGKSLKKSKQFLQDVLSKKRAVPMKRFNRDTGHKPGHIAAGRYPEKASQAILKILSSLESNAQNKGLDVESLHLTTIIPNKASRPARFGRKRGRKTKRSHVDIIAEERVSEKKKKEQKKEEKPKEEKPTEPEVPKKPEIKEQKKKTPKIEKKEQEQKKETKQ